MALVTPSAGGQLCIALSCFALPWSALDLDLSDGKGTGREAVETPVGRESIAGTRQSRMSERIARLRVWQESGKLALELRCSQWSTYPLAPAMSRGDEFAPAPSSALGARTTAVCGCGYRHWHGHVVVSSMLALEGPAMSAGGQAHAMARSAHTNESSKRAVGATALC